MCSAISMNSCLLNVFNSSVTTLRKCLHFKHNRFHFKNFYQWIPQSFFHGVGVNSFLDFPRLVCVKSLWELRHKRCNKVRYQSFISPTPPWHLDGRISALPVISFNFFLYFKAGILKSTHSKPTTSWASN